MKFWPFMIFTVVLTSLIYPIQGHWSWGGSALGGLMDGFTDFAGSTIVHSVGGWAALAGVLLLGARRGKYTADGKVRPIPGANLPMATLGTFILWLGWFGFNGGSQLALGSLDDVNAVAKVIVNTNMAASAGAVVALLLTQLLYRKVDLSLVLNGALSGLVGITAGPDYPGVGVALLIGGIAGGLVVFAVPMFDRLRIDDPVGALSVHLVNGVWGTLAVGIFNPQVSLVSQVVGIATVGAFTFGSSLAVWYVIRLTMGLRVAEHEEMEGIDRHEFGMEAYPEFRPGLIQG
jgi:Amt family ammonium transporter